MYIHIYVYTYLHINMYVHRYIYGCIHFCFWYVYMHVSLFVCIYGCICFIPAHIQTFSRLCVRIPSCTCIPNIHVCKYIYMSVSIMVHMYTCTYIYLYIYIVHTRKFMHTYYHIHFILIGRLIAAATYMYTCMHWFECVLASGGLLKHFHALWNRRPDTNVSLRSVRFEIRRSSDLRFDIDVCPISNRTWRCPIWPNGWHGHGRLTPGLKV